MARPRRRKLTAAMMETIVLMARGITIKETAEQLNASMDTIETRRTRLFEMTGTRNAPHLVAWAFTTGVLDANDFEIHRKEDEDRSNYDFVNKFHR